MQDVTVTHNFKPGDRLRSLRSGRIYIFSDTQTEPPVLLSGENYIPVRKMTAPVNTFMWMNATWFEKAYDL